MAEITKEDVIQFIENMTVLELSQLIKELEERFGVSAAAPVAVAAMPVGAGAAGAAAPVEEEKTEFTVVLTGVGDKKIQVIKEIRAITNLGLKEAKDLVETLPSTVKEGIPKQEAEEIAKKLTEAGATVEIK